MNTVYLLYGYVGDFESKQTLLAIYKSREAAMVAMSERVKNQVNFTLLASRIGRYSNKKENGYV